MVANAPGLAPVRASIITGGSAFLRNTAWIPGRTCSICAGATKDGYPTCWKCQQRAANPGVADRVGSIVYAWRDHQSGRMMHAYKAQAGAPASLDLVQSLLVYGVAGHWPCISGPFGPPDAWAVVPSLAGRPGVHPMAGLVAGLLARFPQIALGPGVEVKHPREFRPENFAAEPNSATHVLLLDDTWTTGAHAQSASAALKTAGANHVTILTVARWLDPAFADTGQFIGGLTADLDPDRCPFTGDYC